MRKKQIPPGNIMINQIIFPQKYPENSSSVMKFRLNKEKNYAFG
jgi:hypothetical protein